MGTIDHPAFAETEMASQVGLIRHRPDAMSMLRQYEEAEETAARIQTLRQHAEQLTDAYRNGMVFGRGEGFRSGFTRGTHWGLLCGAIAGGLVAAIGMALWGGLL